MIMNRVAPTKESRNVQLGIACARATAMRVSEVWASLIDSGDGKVPQSVESGYISTMAMVDALLEIEQKQLMSERIRLLAAALESAATCAAAARCAGKAGHVSDDDLRSIGEKIDQIIEMIALVVLDKKEKRKLTCRDLL